MAKYIAVGNETIEFPDSMSMDQIKTALDTKYGKKKEKSYGERVLTEGLPAVTNFAEDIALSIPAGIRGAGEAVATGSMSRGLEGFQSSMEQLQGAVPRFRDPKVKDAEAALGEGLDELTQLGGSLTMEMAKRAPIGGPIVQALIGHEAEKREPAIRTGGEVATNFAPIPGAGLLSKGVGRIPHVGSKWKADVKAATEAADLKAKVAEAEALAEKLETARQAEFQQAQQPEFPGFDELRKEVEPRTPYNLPESLRIRLEEELNPPVEQRRVGQPELFSQLPESAPELGRQRQAMPMEYTPETGGTSREGKMALGIGQEALREGAGPTQLSMQGLDYPTQKPRLRGPEGILETAMPEEAARAVRQEFTRRENERVGPPTELGSLEGREFRNPYFNYDLYNKQYGQGAIPGLKGLGGLIDSRSQLKTIAEKSKVPFYQEVAKLLLADKKFNPRFSTKNFGDTKVEGGSGLLGGQYRSKSHEVVMGTRNLGDERLTLHEFIHAATFGALEGWLRDPTNPKFSHIAAPARRIQQLYNQFKVDWVKQNRGKSNLPEPYGLLNVHEFLTEGFTKPEFQALLARTKLPEGLRTSSLRTYWDLFVERIGKLLGFTKDQHNYLSELIKSGVDLIQGAGEEARRHFEYGNEKPIGKDWNPGDVGATFDEFKTELNAKGIKIPEPAMKAIWEKNNKPSPEPKAHPKADVIKAVSKIDGLKNIQKLYADRRTLEEIAPDIQATTKDTLLDKASKNTIGKIIQGRFIAKDNPLLSWVSSNIHWNKQGSILQADKRLHGKSRKQPEEGSFYYSWKQLKDESRIAVTKLGYSLMNSETALSAADIQKKAVEVLGREMTKKELTTYNERNAVLSKVVDDVNAYLKKEGRPLVPKLPHYFSPMIFDGPFKVKFLDKDGNTVKIFDSYLKPNIEKLRKNFSEYKLEEVPDSGLRGDVDWSQFDWMLRQLDKETRDPAAKAINEALTRLGFSKHRKQRKGVKDVRMTDVGRNEMLKYEKQSEQYIRAAYDYIANRELDKMYVKVNELKEANHIPYTKTWALEAIDTARGGSNQAFDAMDRTLSALVSGAIEIGTAGKVVLPQRFTRDFLRLGNKAKTTLLIGLGNFTHLFSQIIQAPTFMPAKILAMMAESGVNQVRLLGSVSRAGQRLLKWDRDLDAQKLQEIGAFEPTFKNDWSTYAGDANPEYRKKVLDTATGVTALTWVEANAVRRPAALLFLEVLRDIGYDQIAKSPDEIYHVAKEMTDQYMVSTRFYEKPHVFSRTGLLGMALSPLQSFTTTWLGMFREFTKLSAQGLKEGSVAKQLPLATFLGMSLITSGMSGMIGIKEWDALANLANSTWGFNIPTGTEWIMSKFKSDKVRFGLLSEASGYNVGATFASPSITGSFAPGLQMYRDIGNVAWQGVKATGVLGEAGKPTNVEIREMMKGVAPRFFPIPHFGWGGIEEHYSKPGTPYQEASGKAGPYTRTEKDWTARKLGTYTLDEIKEKTKFYAAKKDMQSRTVHFSKTMKSAVDRMLDNDVKSLPELWKSLVERNYTGQEIQEGLKREISARLLESDVKGMGTGSSSRQRELIMLYQQLQ